MKLFNFIGSVLPNTNRIISDSHSDWSGIRAGTLIKFIDDNVFYYAAKAEPFFYIKDFEVAGKDVLVNDNASIYLAIGDTLTFSYKEFELFTVLEILDGGKDYQVNDTVFLEGGIATTNIEDGHKEAAHLKVADVSAWGGITKLVIENNGKYITVPEEKCSIKGGTGTNAKIRVSYKLSDIRASIERDINKIEAGDKTKIILSYPLPDGVVEGKLSAPKNSLTLTAPYVGKVKKGAAFEAARDFSLNYGWPFIIPGSFSMELLYNNTLVAQDQKIKELEDRLAALEKPA